MYLRLCKGPSRVLRGGTSLAVPVFFLCLTPPRWPRDEPADVPASEGRAKRLRDEEGVWDDMWGDLKAEGSPEAVSVLGSFAGAAAAAAATTACWENERLAGGRRSARARAGSGCMRRRSLCRRRRASLIGACLCRPRLSKKYATALRLFPTHKIPPYTTQHYLSIAAPPLQSRTSTVV